ncbi:RDD family protein [Lysobacter brunescens]|uniref:RDD family protein n=1 Tax=Lysobacter brunescens TaxID=262323 RepID=A0ABW2Y8U5_9GAMM
MTEWYYSDAQRQQQGPVGSEELASLHGRGLLAPDSLVWREGLAAWVPWREIMHEVVSGAAPAATRTDVSAADIAPASDMPAAEPFAAASGSPFGDPSPAAPTPAAADDAFRPYAIAEASPYAPPQASVSGVDAGYVAGGHVVHAGLWKRFAASVIDSFVTTILTYALLIPLMLVGFGSMGAMGAGGDNPFAAGASVAMMLLVYPIMFAIPSAYFGWMQSSSLQASLGKMAIGIKVVRGDGTRVSFWRAFLRSLFYVVFGTVTCGLGVLVSGLMAALTERKQALHDMVCDTLVVDKHAFTDHPEWQSEELGTVTIVILVLFALLFVGMIAAYAIMGAVMLGGMGN